MAARVEKPGSWMGRQLGAVRQASMMEWLRIGTGLVWVINLVFIVDPANQYWAHFSHNALSFAPTTIGGPGFAQYVSSHPLFFSWVIALVTAYLAVALTFGFTTRLACFVGSFFSAVLLATQFGSTFFFPGGTDVGEHPLYILIYAALVVGGAGHSLSVETWIRNALAARRIAPTAPVRAPRRAPWSTSISTRTIFSYFVAGTLISMGVGFGLVLFIPAQPAGSTTNPLAGPVSYVNLSINVAASNGWPQYSPANFSVPTGTVIFTIVDNDSPMQWNGCPCSVGGTVDGQELINGTSVGVIPAANVAHSFNVPELGIQIMSPGQSIVQFTVALERTGQFVWFCIVPCGTGADPYNTPPMGVPGWMTGTMTVT